MTIELPVVNEKNVIIFENYIRFRIDDFLHFRLITWRHIKQAI
jgi:hypothetical protein